jgi:hypothetical protein
MGTFLPI